MEETAHGRSEFWASAVVDNVILIYKDLKCHKMESNRGCFHVSYTFLCGTKWLYK